MTNICLLLIFSKNILPVDPRLQNSSVHCTEVTLNSSYVKVSSKEKPEEAIQYLECWGILVRQSKSPENVAFLSMFLEESNSTDGFEIFPIPVCIQFNLSTVQIHVYRSSCIHIEDIFAEIPLACVVLSLTVVNLWGKRFKLHS